METGWEAGLEVSPRYQLLSLAGLLSEAAGPCGGSDAIAAGLRSPPHSGMQVSTEINLTVGISDCGRDSVFL